MTQDTVLRAMTDDGAFRVVVARTKDTVQGIVKAQRVSGHTARIFGDLITGAVLARETMAPNLRVQSILKGAQGSGSLVADAHPSGSTRGLSQRKTDSDLDLGPGALMQLMRSMPSGRTNQGVVEVPSGGGVSEALMTYLQVSEAVVSTIAVDTLFDGDNVSNAGGYIVQLLPEADRGPLMIMTERLEDFKNIEAQLKDADFSPDWLMEQLLYGMNFTRLEESPVSFTCWCDELRLVGAIASLGRSEIEDLISDGEVLEITCDYCLREYRIPPARLRGLVEAS